MRITRTGPRSSLGRPIIGGMVNLAGELPSSLKAQARWERISDAAVPVMLVHPDWSAGHAVPTVLWMHGRTAYKELDPGRYLRWMRAGFGVCSIDLPGHGERHDEALGDASRSLEVILQMAGEIDGIVEGLGEFGLFDMDRLAVGGISAGGMATLHRLTKPHRFVCSCVEATTGSWQDQQARGTFGGLSPEELRKIDPMANLENWREIPLQVIHARRDEWVSFEGQRRFFEALKQRYRYPENLELIVYEETGAPYEHIGFGRMASDAKNRQVEFLERYLGAEGVTK